MLVLGRKEGEKIKINNEITITVIQARKGFARLGFEAPKDTIIDREEIHIRRSQNPHGGKKKEAHKIPEEENEALSSCCSVHAGTTEECKEKCQHESDGKFHPDISYDTNKCLKCGEYYR